MERHEETRHGLHIVKRDDGNIPDCMSEIPLVSLSTSLRKDVETESIHFKEAYGLISNQAAEDVNSIPFKITKKILSLWRKEAKRQDSKTS